MFIHMTEKKDSTENRRITSKQIAAWIGIILLSALYIITLLVAIFDTSSSGKLFALCLFATVAIPLLIWIYTWMYGKLTGKHTIADFDTEADKTADK
jgi:amino acid transporter